MKGWMKRASGALFLLLGIALGARVMFALLAPMLPLLITGAVLIVVFYVASGLWRRL